jgi:hypothetical protein
MASTPVPFLSVGTIVLRQARGVRTIHYHGRIVDSFTKSDKLGRRQIWYRVQVLESGLTRDWPGSHCQPVTPAPASA